MAPKYQYCRRYALPSPSHPPKMARLFGAAPMPFSIHPYRRVPGQCSVTYNAEPLQGHGTVWNLSCTGWRLSGDLPMRPDEALSLTVTLPNEQRIKIPEAVVRWSTGQECAVEKKVIEQHTQAHLQHDVKRLVQEPTEILL